MVPTPVLLPGKSHGWRSLVGCSPWDLEESDTTEQLHFHFSLSCIGEGNGNQLQCSCLENPRDGGAWWAAVYGVAQSWTRLKWLSSSMFFTLMLWWYSDFYFFFSVLNKPRGQEYLFCSPLFSSFWLPKAAFAKNIFNFTSYFTLNAQSFIKPIHLKFHVKCSSFLFQISVFFLMYIPLFLLFGSYSSLNPWAYV